MVTILGYHNIDIKKDSNFSDKLFTTPKNFETQMKYIFENNYKVLPLSELHRLINDQGDNKCILTFDDGYKNFYTNAFPILKKLNINATLFVITSKIGQEDYCDINMLKEMQESGIEIGSHSVSHPHLSKINDHQLYEEVYDSRKHLQELLKSPIETFCYPYGDYNSKVKKLVETVGYKYAITTVAGTISSSETDYYNLKRIAPEYTDNLNDFIFKINYGKYPSK